MLVLCFWLNCCVQSNGYFQFDSSFIMDNHWMRSITDAIVVAFHAVSRWTMPGPVLVQNMGFILKCVWMEEKFVEPKKLVCVRIGERILSDRWIINELVSGDMQECRHILFTLFQSLPDTSRALVLFDFSRLCSTFFLFDAGLFKDHRKFGRAWIMPKTTVYKWHHVVNFHCVNLRWGLIRP